MSRTKEEFYTVRCQVADMKNLYVSTSIISHLVYKVKISVGTIIDYNR